MSCRPALLAAALAGGFGLVVPPALAQGAPLQGSMPRVPPRASSQQRAPAALPGAVGTTPEAALPEASAASMKPNEALFAAVNRGDIAAAREALSRGADVDSRNVLGLTPVELSVDLGRNDITFLLLSMRGSGSAGRTTPPPARTATATPPRVAATRVATGAPRGVPAPRPAQTVTLTPGRDPGVPAPQAGFLGFGAR